MRISIFRKGHFNAAHRLFNNEWSQEENSRIFGICSNPNFHGHNYELEVKVSGEYKMEDGILIDLKILKEIIRDNVEDKFDHKNLNLDLPEFENIVPSAENICIIIWQILRNHIDNKLDIMVRLYETPRNFVEYAGE